MDLRLTSLFLWHKMNQGLVLISLADHYDVKMPCHLILSKLAEKCSSAILAGNDTIMHIDFLLIFQILKFSA